MLMSGDKCLGLDLSRSIMISLSVAVDITSMNVNRNLGRTDIRVSYRMLQQRQTF